MASNSANLLVKSSPEGLKMSNRLQSFYSIPPYNTDLDITQSCCGSQFFYHGILQRNYRKMTIKWSFSYNSFVKFPIIT